MNIILVMGKTNCAVRGCNSKTREGICMFAFPKNPFTSQLWLKACNREDLSGKTTLEIQRKYKVCELHFEEKCISKGGYIKRLFVLSVPTKFLGLKRDSHVLMNDMPRKKVILSGSHESENLCNTPTTNLTENSSLPGPSKSDYSEIIPAMELIKSKSLPGPESRMHQRPSALSVKRPRMRSFQKKIKATKMSPNSIFINKNKIEWRVLDFKNMCENFLNKPLAQAVVAQLVLKNKKPQIGRCSVEYLQFVLSLYFLNPAAYSVMSNLLCIPTKRNIYTMTKKLRIEPGLHNDIVFKLLDIKTKALLDIDKHCTLNIDEVPLKSFLFYHTGRDELVGLHDIGTGKKKFIYARNALIINIRGLHSNWKQPVAYFFLENHMDVVQLKRTLEECVMKLSNVGLIVDAIVSDMKMIFVKLARVLGVTTDCPEVKLADKKITYMFDICHLMTATRNNLLRSNIEWKDRRTSWTFIKEFYQRDSVAQFRYAPKLTKAHLCPTNVQKKNVKLATQILSHATASGLNAYMKFGELPDDARGTIDFLENINNLFDMFDSLKDQSNIFKSVFVGSDFQVNYLNDMIAFMKDMQVFDKEGNNVTSKLRFKKCWLVTIKGLMNVWTKLSSSGFASLKTRRLSSNCPVNLIFGSDKQPGGNLVNLIPVRFEKSFKSLFFRAYFHPGNIHSTEDDMDKLLLALDTKKTVILNEKVSSDSIKAIQLPDYDYRNEDFIVPNKFTYVCAYIIKKSLEVHKCNVCVAFAEDFDQSLHASQRTTSRHFRNYIFELEKIFLASFSSICLTNGISLMLFKFMEDIKCEHPCNDFPKTYVLKLFIRLRIFFTIKYSNDNLKDNEKNKTAKTIDVLSHI